MSTVRVLGITPDLPVADVEDATAPVDSALTVEVDDVEEAYAQARAAGYEVVHPLTTEPWGGRRFFVRAPDGTVVNIAQHSG